jgi:hypothetical protein
MLLRADLTLKHCLLLVGWHNIRIEGLDLIVTVIERMEKLV